MRFFRFILLLLVCALSFPTESGALDRGMLRWIQNKPTITEITISGNTAFTDSQIKKQLYSRTRNLLGVLRGDRRTRVQRESFGRDTLELRFLYITNGYLAVEIDESFEMILPDSSARVVIKLDEGRQFTYGDVTINGTFEARLLGDFEKISSRLERGRPINFLAVRQVVFNIKTILANEGYPYADVSSHIDTTLSSSIAHVSINIQSDSLVHFGDVVVEGSRRYPEYIARRELTIKRGDIYRRQTIIDSKRRLFESGYFSTVLLQEPQNQQDRLNPEFVLRVRERKPLYVTIKTGAGQSDVADLTWDLSAGVGKRNLFGSRRLDLSNQLSLSIDKDVNILEHNYRLRFTEPWFLGLRMPLSLTFTFEPEIEHPIRDFRWEQWSIALSTLKRFGREIRLTGGLEYQSVDIFGVPEALIDSTKEEVGITVRRRLYVQFKRDSRNNVFVPQRGSYTDISGEYFGGFLGGDFSFIRLQGSWSSYQVVWPGWISATRIGSGYVRAFGGSQSVPLDELLNLGGANTIRGYAENSMGPLLSDGSNGSGFTVLFNQEFRWKTLQVLRPIPILGDIFKHLPIWQSIFVDIGNGYEEINDISLKSLAISYGTGVQIQSPAGPIRLDYAQRVKTDHIPFDDRWHFTILYAF